MVLLLLGEKHKINWTETQLQAVKALSFLLRMVASLELFQLYTDEGEFIEIYPQDNPSIIQIFPVSNPIEGYFKLNPDGSLDEFLDSVRKGTNLSIQSMDLGGKFRKNFKYPLVLLVWGFPSYVPKPKWNGMSLLISTDKKGIEALEQVITMLKEKPKKHLRVLKWKTSR
jgi:hypothetical protein